MKYKISILTVIINFAIYISGTCQIYDWSNHCGSDWDDWGYLNKDTLGNFYLSGLLLVGPGNSGGLSYFDSDTVSVQGSGDIFIAKYNSLGVEEWARRCGALNNHTPNETGHAYYDKFSNSLYLIGAYVEDAYFGNTLLLGNNGHTGFITKLDLNGNFIWARKLGGGNGVVSGITSNNKGNLYIIGRGDSLLVSSNYLAEIDTSGHCLWAKPISEIHNFNIADIDFSSDSLFISAEGSKNGSFDSAFINTTYSHTILFSVFDTSGNIISYQTVQSPNNLQHNITASFYNHSGVVPISYTDSVFVNDSLFTCDGNGILLINYDKSDRINWARQINYFGILRPQAIDYSFGTIFITGIFNNQLTYDSTVTLTAVNGDNCFVLHIDENGNLISSFILPNSEGKGIVRSNDGLVILCGAFRDSLQLGNKQLISYGQSDIFIAKLDSLIGIDEQERTARNKLLIYANPNNGTCQIVIPNEILHYDNLRLIIRNSLGYEIYDGKPEKLFDNIIINLQKESTGNYFVTLTAGEKQFFGTIIYIK